MKNVLNKYIPISFWLLNYQKSWLKGDLIAGLVVCVVLIPQGMAYALIAGIDPIYGLYTALVPPVVYAILGSARQVSPGPVAMDSLLVMTGVSAIAELGSDYYMPVVFTLTLVVGIVQFSLGFFRLGFLVNFMSKPVISGFTSAAALVIGFNQFKHLLGVEVANSSYIHRLFGDLISSLQALDRTTLIVGGLSCLIIYVLKKVNKSIPSALIVVVLGIVAIKISPDLFESVAVVGYIPSGLPDFRLPTWDWNLIEDLLPISITLAFLGFLELISIAKSQENLQDEYKVRANQEFLALGFSNMAGSLFGGFASAASFSRSAINHDNGAKTPLANLISSGLMVLVLLYLTPLFYDLPVAVLASIIVVAVFGLIKVKETFRLWKGSKRDFWMWIVTFVFTATIGIVQGVLIGIVVSLLVLLARSTIPHYAVLGRIEGTNYFRNISRFKDVIINPEVLILRFDSELYFANADYFFEQINTLAQDKGEDLKLIVLDFESVNGMDSSSADSLKQQIHSFAKRGVKLYFTNVKGPARDTMTRFNIVKELGTECFFMSIAGAVDYYETGELGIKEDLIPYINQSNKYRV